MIDIVPLVAGFLVISFFAGLPVVSLVMAIVIAILLLKGSEVLSSGSRQDL
jgi:hypothetical protein